MLLRKSSRFIVPLKSRCYTSSTSLQYTHPLDRVPIVTEKDVAQLEQLETGGRLELQRWMEMDEHDYDCEFLEIYKQLNEQDALDELIAIESQGRVGFLWKRR